MVGLALLSTTPQQSRKTSYESIGLVKDQLAKPPLMAYLALSKKIKQFACYGLPRYLG